MGVNVFGLTKSDDLAERTINAIESFCQTMQVSTQLTEHGDNKQKAIDAVVSQLEHHGLKALGENKTITLEASRQILTSAIA